MVTKEIMNIKEVAKYLGLNGRTVYNLVKLGKIPAIKIGRQWRIKKENLDEMFNQKRKTKEQK